MTRTCQKVRTKQFKKVTITRQTQQTCPEGPPYVQLIIKLYMTRVALTQALNTTNGTNQLLETSKFTILDPHRLGMNIDHVCSPWPNETHVYIGNQMNNLQK